MKSFVLALALGLLGCLAMTSAGAAAPSFVSPLRATVMEADWQWPQFLPPGFRNHCAIDRFSGRAYCSNHCGPEYEFYFCSPLSFGCCRMGYGYCDWSGLLRCHP
jgi:hypothetical protein